MDMHEIVFHVSHHVDRLFSNWASKMIARDVIIVSYDFACMHACLYACVNTETLIVHFLPMKYAADQNSN